MSLDERPDCHLFPWMLRTLFFRPLGVFDEIVFELVLPFLFKLIQLFFRRQCRDAIVIKQGTIDRKRGRTTRVMTTV